MSAIKYEGEFMTFLCGFDGEPTVQDAWSAAIKLMEEKFTSHNTARDEICPLCHGVGIVDLIWPNDQTLCPKCEGSGQTSPVA